MDCSVGAEAVRRGARAGRERGEEDERETSGGGSVSHGVELYRGLRAVKAARDGDTGVSAGEDGGEYATKGALSREPMATEAHDTSFDPDVGVIVSVVGMFRREGGAVYRTTGAKQVTSTANIVTYNATLVPCNANRARAGARAHDTYATLFEVAAIRELIAAIRKTVDATRLEISAYLSEAGTICLDTRAIARSTHANLGDIDARPGARDAIDRLLEVDLLDRRQAVAEKAASDLLERLRDVGHTKLDASPVGFGACKASGDEKLSRLVRYGPRAVDDCDAVAQHNARFVLDDRAKERVVRASEDHDVDLGGCKRFEVATRGEARHFPVGPSLFGERYEERRGLSDDLGARGFGCDRACVGA